MCTKEFSLLMMLMMIAMKIVMMMVETIVETMIVEMIFFSISWVAEKFTVKIALEDVWRQFAYLMHRMGLL